MIFTVVGLGYVGMSLATLLSTKYKVNAIDIHQERADKINNGIPPIKDEYIEKYFKEKDLNLKASLEYEEAYKESDYVIIATPTDYNEETNLFDTDSVELVIENIINVNPNVAIVIKSTVPIGYTEKIKERYKKSNIFFSPEFLREGRALYDNVYPSRIIVGTNEDYAVKFGEILKNLSLNDAQLLSMNNTEAEAVKLFSNTYLAMRVSYFNELDIFAEEKGLDSKQIIEGVGLDPRIGSHYNNPSFGYGGYCLPKDTKQMQANFAGIPNALITAIVSSNDIRKNHIASKVISKNPKTVGVYGLAMKTGSDNFRYAAIFDIIDLISDAGIEVIIYENLINDSEYKGMKVYSDLKSFANDSDIILNNRHNQELDQYKDKVYSRDIFNVN